MRGANRDVARRLIQAAVEVNWEKGYDGATVSEIVRKAGVAQGTFYLYFDHKRDILKALAAKVQLEVEARIADEVHEDNDPLEKIRSALLATFGVYQEYQRVAAPLYSGTAHVEFQRYSETIGQTFVDRLTGWIAEGKEAGVFCVQDAELAARFIISLYERVAYSCLLSLYPQDFEEIFPHLVGFMERALGVDADG